MTTRLKQPMLSLPRPIPIQLLLCKTTTCLTRPVTSFVPQMKKDISKTTTAKIYPAKKCEAMHTKLISLWLNLLYCYLKMQGLLNVCNKWTKIGLVFPIILVVTMLDSQYRVPHSNLLGGFKIKVISAFHQAKVA